MQEYEIFKEFAAEQSIENLVQQIPQKMEEYRKTRNKKVEMELIELLKDKEKIYNLDDETIKKYLKI